jgi:hypothetical protein
MNLLRLGLWSAASLAAMAAAGPASATEILDNVLTRAYYGDSPSNSSGYNYYQDTIGSSSTWDTKAIVVERNGANFNFSIYTNKDSNDEGGISYADFFIDLNPDNSITGPFGNWNLGLDLQSGKLYALDGSYDWATSQDIFDDSGSIYGGLFRSAACGTSNGGDGDPAACDDVPVGPGGQISGTDVRGFEPVTKIDDPESDDYLATIDIDIDQAIGDPYNASSVISFSIAASILNQGGFDVFWGTAVCANDSIWGHVPGSPPGETPEPLALSLFGLGLAGAYFGARRRRAA